MTPSNGHQEGVLTTRRLRLEPCAPEHLSGLHTLNADPQVMRYITGQPETLEQTRAMIERVQARWAEFGYSWWSFVERATGEVIGAGCIQNLRRGDAAVPDPSCPLEIGWRLRPERWHQGLASEAARAMSAFAFDELKAAQLLAVCHPDNAASASVMRRLGMEFLGLDTWYGRTLATYRLAADRFQSP
jgi:RimJ/RimL family protein N-acetyltransferase